MATVEEVVRDLVASVDSDVGFLTAVRWVDKRYKQLVSRVRFPHLRKIGEIQIPAKYATGTVAATRDSTTVTGTDTLWVTNIGTGTQQYWYIRIASAWYKISSIGGETAITLATNFSEDTVTANAYNAVKRIHPLASTARWLGDFCLTRLRLNLGQPISLTQLDMEAPGRSLVGSYPRRVAQIGIDSNNYITVEFYPYPENSEIIHYVYWDLPTALTVASTIPPQIDDYILHEGALIDMYRYLKSRAYHKGKIDEGNSWRNDEQAQETRWERRIQEAVRTGRPVDDITFILQSVTGGQVRTTDIRNARDIVLDRWTWPSS